MVGSIGADEPEAVAQSGEFAAFDHLKLQQRFKCFYHYFALKVRKALKDFAQHRDGRVRDFTLDRVDIPGSKFTQSGDDALASGGKLLMPWLGFSSAF